MEPDQIDSLLKTRTLESLGTTFQVTPPRGHRFLRDDEVVSKGDLIWRYSGEWEASPSFQYCAGGFLEIREWNKYPTFVATPLKIRTICISDVHLGSKFAQAEALRVFLKDKTPEHLFIVGDFIDGWKFARKRWDWNDQSNNLIRKILKMSKQGTQVKYAVGNHDEFLREFFHKDHAEDHFGSISFGNSFVHTDAKGNKYLVVHGDAFDTVIKYAPFLAWIGDMGYEVLLRMNHWINTVRNWFGRKSWSFSNYAKQQVKKATSHICKFEEHLAHLAESQGCQGVICGHIHCAADKNINGVRYLNCGDWVESCTALIEYENGLWEIYED